MKTKSFPGYEMHLLAKTHGDSEELKKAQAFQRDCLMNYEVPEGMKVEDREIESGVEGEKMAIRIFTPADVSAKAPMVLDIHGGAWVGGCMALDYARCIAIAVRIPAIVVTVEYHLSGKKYHFPTPLLDCYKAYMWMHDNAAEIGGDGSRIGIHGSSSGGNLAAGLALYLRDKKAPTPALNVLNCPCISTNFMETPSFQQYYEYDPGVNFPDVFVEDAYLGGYDGTTPSYYAFPGNAHDLRNLGPHMVIVGEYDTLRDDGINYALRLLRLGVPCELLSAARVGHCYTCIPHPYTDLTHDMIAMSFRREFGMM